MTHDFGVILKLLGNLHDDSPAFQINGIPWLNNNKKNLDPQKTIHLKILKLQGYSLQLTGFSQVFVHFFVSWITPSSPKIQGSRLAPQAYSDFRGDVAAFGRHLKLPVLDWVVPLPSNISNSHHKDYYSFSRGLMTCPNFSMSPHKSS